MGNEPVTILTGVTVTDGVITMLKILVAVCAGELESCTAIAIGNVPDCVGVPLIWPSGAKDNPDGSEPEDMDQV